MKKTNFFKIVMTLVMAFVVTGAFAQTSWVDSTAVNQGIDTVTVGTTVPYYVEPDQYFNPSTTAVTDTASVTSTFSWDLSRFADTPTLEWQSNNNSSNPGNYVELTFNVTNAAGEYIYVTETSDAGTCPGDPVSLEVRVIDAPEIDLTTTTTGIIGSDITICDGADEQDDVVQVTFTTSVADLYNFTLDYTYTVETTTDQTTWTEATALDYTGGSAITGIDALTYDLNDHTNDFAIVDNKSTRYTYTISGVTDRISRKSDYLDNTDATAGSWTLYDTTSETVVITVNPAPQTGPIYHISNMWAE